VTSVHLESSYHFLNTVLQNVSAITFQIQQGKNLKEILQQAIADVRTLLQVDRSFVYRLLEEGAVVAFASADTVGASLIAQPLSDPINAFLEETYLEQYQQPTALSDIRTEPLPACNAERLEQLGIQANLAVPILNPNCNQNRLWGLLIIHHCQSPREWQPIEVQYLQQVALLLGVAVQQADLKQQLASISRDVTERKQAENLLRRYERIVSATPDCVSLIDRNYVYQVINQTYLRWHQKTYDEIIGHSVSDILGQEFFKTFTQPRLDRCLTGEPQIYEMWQDYGDGQRRYIRATYAPYIELDGTISGVVVNIHDLTQLKQTEEALRESEARWQFALEGAGDGVWDWNLQTSEIFFSQQWKAMLGYAEDEIENIVKEWENRIHPNDKAKCFADLEEHFRGNTLVYQNEHRVRCRDGSDRWVLDRGKVIEWTEDGKPLRMIGTYTDITERKQAEEQIQMLNAQLELQVRERTGQLQQSLHFEELLKRITDRVRDSLDEAQILQAAVDELAYGLRVETCDTGIYNAEQTTSTIAYEFTNSLPPALGRTFKIVNAPHSHIYDYLFQGQVCQFCNVIPDSLRPDQRKLTILACPILDEKGVLGDIWLFKAAQEVFNELEVRLVRQVANQCAIALRQSRLFQASQLQVKELERLNQLKDDFLSTVSHELRTPMSNIKMATQMLEISLNRLGILADESNPIHRYFSVLQSEGQREIRLINDLLDLARLDAGTEPLNITSIDLQSYLPRIAAAFIERIQEQQQQFLIQISEELPPLATDASYLERILSELLNNACKYTPAGETIMFSAQATSEGLEIWVSNSGVEIPPAEYEGIFDKFYRIPNNDPWRHGGTGLGLALVKKLIHRLGGNIRVESANKQIKFILFLALLN
jgi:PAS domain S-box-containing protein